MTSRLGTAAATYAIRDGKILVLKRTDGEGPTFWDVPGGAGEGGETFEQTALRELFEEARLTPTGPLTHIATTTVAWGGQDQFVWAMFACECADGEVVLSDTEHSDYRWMNALEYRASYLTDEAINELDGPLLAIVRVAQQHLDRFIASEVPQR